VISRSLVILLDALAGSPPALPERVALAVAIGGQAKLPPRDWLHARDLATHAQQVAAELGSRLAAAAAQQS